MPPTIFFISAGHNFKTEVKKKKKSVKNSCFAIFIWMES